MPLPSLSPRERLERQQQKQQMLLAFLASGEVWTSAVNAALLWRLSPDATANTLRQMTRDGLLSREAIPDGARSTFAIWGITPDGVAACSAASPDAPEHQLGRVHPSSVRHHLAVQRVRIVAEQAGWRNWRAGRQLYGNNLPVVPDALGTDPRGDIVAIELERNVKSLKRRREVLSSHVLTMSQKRAWNRVLYVCDSRCNAVRLRDVYMSLDELETPAGRAQMTDVHRARFSFVDLDDFKG